MGATTPLFKHYLPLLAAVLLAGCSLPGDSALQAKVDRMTPCEKINSLVSTYTDNFNAIKGPLVSKRFLNVWTAKVDAIGDGCQVWQSGTQTTYMCTRNAPDKAIGEAWLEQSVDVMQQCLPDWQREATRSEDKGSEGFVWTKAGNYPSISAQLIPVRGRQSTFYYFVGDRDHWY